MARALALQVGSPAFFSLAVEEDSGIRYVRVKGVLSSVGDTCVFIVNGSLCRILNLSIHRVTSKGQKLELGVIRMSKSQLLLSRPTGWRKVIEIDHEGLIECAEVQEILQKHQPDDLSGSDIEAVGQVPRQSFQNTKVAPEAMASASQGQFLFEEDAEEEDEEEGLPSLVDPMLQGMAQMGQFLQGGSTTQQKKVFGGSSPLVEPPSQASHSWNQPTLFGAPQSLPTMSAAQATSPFQSSSPYITAMPHMSQNPMGGPASSAHFGAMPPSSVMQSQMGTGGYAMGPPPGIGNIPLSPNMSLDDMMKVMLLQQLQQNQTRDSTNVTSRAFDRMDALQRELWDNPQAIVSAYRAHVMHQMRVKANQRWAWTDWWGAHPYGRFRSVGRLSYGLCELLEAFEVGQPMVAQAIAVQLVKSCHQFSIYGGSWHVAWPLSRLREPYYKEKFGGTATELSAVSGYLEAESELKSRIGPDSYYTSGNATDEPDEEGNKDDTVSPKGKAKGKKK